VLLALSGGAAASHVAAEGTDAGSSEVPLVYAEEASSLPDPSTVPAVGVTPDGVFITEDDSGWEAIPPATRTAEGTDGQNTDEPEATTDAQTSIGSLTGIEVVDPADGYEALQGVLDDYGWTPVMVLLTAGTLTVETNVRVPSNTWLAGVGQGTVIELADGATLDVSGIVRIPRDRNDVVCRDFVIDGNRANVTNQGHEYGFFTKDASNIVCERLEVRNCPGYGFDPHAGPMWETTTDIRLSNCVARNNGKDGITFAGIEHGVIDSCVARENDRYGVNITDPDTRGVSVVNSISSENGNAGVVVQNDPRVVTISNNQVHDNGGDGIKISTVENPVSHCAVVGNAVRENGRYGVAVLRADNVAVVGNNFWNNTRTDGTAECLLSAGDDWQARDCLVVGNTIKTESEFGIEERSENGRPNLVVANAIDGTDRVAIKRRNDDSRVAFNLGTSYRTSGTVTVGPEDRRTLIEELPPGGHRIADLQVTPLGSLGSATYYWVAEANDVYEVVLDRTPGQAVDFSFVIDSRG